MTDPNHLSAAEAVALLGNDGLTVEALVGACLDRAEARAEIRAWTWLDRGKALAQARAADHAGRPGLLAGLPIGVKDIIDTVDMPTEYGSPIYRGNRPFADAASVALIRMAGGTIMGKTVTTEFANRFPGATVNPYNAAHTPGGSSSGSAAAVADFQVPAALGTQTGGSVIRPAAFCGVIGYKPSFGEFSPQRHQAAMPQPRHARHHLPQPRRPAAAARRAGRRAGLRDRPLGRRRRASGCAARRPGSAPSSRCRR